MNLKRLQDTWEHHGQEDPMWAILAKPDARGNRWDSGEFFRTGREEIDWAMDFVLARIPELRRERALDFGCGLGRLTQALSNHFTQVVGVDIAPSMIAGAKRFSADNEKCDFVVNNQDDLSIFSDHIFDFVYSNIVLQHMPSELSERYMKELVRVLRPGGVAFIQLPAPTTGVGARILRRLLPIEWLNWRLRHRTAPPWELHGKSIEDVKRIIADTGASLSDISSTPVGSGRWWVSQHYLILRN